MTNIPPPESRHMRLLQKLRRTFPRQLGIEDVEARHEDYIVRPTHGEVSRAISEILQFMVDGTPVLVFIRASPTCSQGREHANPTARAELQWMLNPPPHDPLREFSGQGSANDPLIVSLATTSSERTLFDVPHCCLDVRVITMSPPRMLRCVALGTTTFETATETEADYYRKLEERQLDPARQEFGVQWDDAPSRKKHRSPSRKQVPSPTRAAPPETRGRLVDLLDCATCQRAAEECMVHGDIADATASGSLLAASGRIHSSGPAWVEVLRQPLSRYANRTQGACSECGRSWEYVWNRSREQAGRLNIDLVASPDIAPTSPILIERAANAYDTNSIAGAFAAIARESSEHTQQRADDDLRSLFDVPVPPLVGRDTTPISRMLHHQVQMLYPRLIGEKSLKKGQDPIIHVDVPFTDALMWWSRPVDPILLVTIRVISDQPGKLCALDALRSIATDTASVGATTILRVPALALLGRRKQLLPTISGLRIAVMFPNKRIMFEQDDGKTRWQGAR